MFDIVFRAFWIAYCLFKFTTVPDDVSWIRIIWAAFGVAWAVLLVLAVQRYQRRKDP